MIVEVALDGADIHLDWEFHSLPARPLVRRELHVDALADDAVESALRTMIAEAPDDAVLTIRVVGSIGERAWRALSASNLRRLSPSSMNIELKLDGDVALVRPPSIPRRSDEVLELPF